MEDNYNPKLVIVAHYSEPSELIDADERKDFELIEEGREELEQLIKEFSDVLSEKLGCTKVYEHKIETDSDIPVRQKPYKLSPNKKMALNKQIDQMLAVHVQVLLLGVLLLFLLQNRVLEEMNYSIGYVVIFNS